MQQPCMPTHELLKFQFQQEQAKMRHFMLQQSQNMEQYLLQQQVCMQACVVYAWLYTYMCIYTCMYLLITHTKL